MGWTSIVASHYKYVNGRRVIDRKAECDSLFNDDMVSNAYPEKYEKIGKFEVLKSSMVGSTYYAAVKRTEFATDTEPEKSIIFAAICLTSTDMKSYHNFSYKDMDETCGPYKCDCPKAILDLLTPTDSEWANKWRQACRETLANKAKPNALNKLPIGTVIKFIAPYDMVQYKKGDEITVTKKVRSYSRKRTNTFWVSGNYYYSTKTIGNDYEIVRKAVGNV